MGGGTFSRDVPAVDLSYKSAGGLDLSVNTQSVEKVEGRRSVEKSLLMAGGRIIKCPYETPNIWQIDVTGSMGELVYLLHRTGKRIAGQLNERQYSPNPGCSMFGIGDAKFDTAPIQANDFTNKPDDFHEMPGLIWREKGGGGNAMESYHFGWFSCLRRCSYPENVRKGVFHIIGDEGFYDVMTATDQMHFGVPEATDIAVEELIAELLQRFHVFVYAFTTNSGYDYRSIQNQWKKYFGSHVLVDIDTKAMTDLMLGCTAMSYGVSADEYDEHLAEQEQTSARRKYVRKTLAEIEFASGESGSSWKDQIQL